MKFINANKWVQDRILWDEASPELGYRGFEVELKTPPDFNFVASVRGAISCAAEELTYQIDFESYGAVYRLDVNHSPHTNPDGTKIGDPHKHRWRNARLEESEAYQPKDITHSWDKPTRVWLEFCDETNISHDGMEEPRLNYQPSFA